MLQVTNVSQFFKQPVLCGRLLKKATVRSFRKTALETGKALFKI